MKSFLIFSFMFIGALCLGQQQSQCCISSCTKAKFEASTVSDLTAAAQAVQSVAVLVKRLESGDEKKTTCTSLGTTTIAKTSTKFADSCEIAEESCEDLCCPICCILCCDLASYSKDHVSRKKLTDVKTL